MFARFLGSRTLVVLRQVSTINTKLERRGVCGASWNVQMSRCPNGLPNASASDMWTLWDTRSARLMSKCWRMRRMSLDAVTNVAQHCRKCFAISKLSRTSKCPNDPNVQMKECPKCPNVRMSECPNVRHVRMSKCPNNPNVQMSDMSECPNVRMSQMSNMLRMSECPNVRMYRMSECPWNVPMPEKCPNVTSDVVVGLKIFSLMSKCPQLALECPECPNDHRCPNMFEYHKCPEQSKPSTTLRIANVTNRPTCPTYCPNMSECTLQNMSKWLLVIMSESIQMSLNVRMSKWFPNGPNVHYVRMSFVMSECPNVPMPKICSLCHERFMWFVGQKSSLMSK